MDGGQAAYAQLLGVGVVWMAFHCSGMCGPLVLGLRLGGTSTFQAATRVLIYQAGKAITYAWMGALAGALGLGVTRFLKVSTPVLGLVMAGVMVLAWWRSRHGSGPLLLQPGKRAVGQRFSDLASKALRAVSAQPGPERALMVGLLMGLLPCMIVAWALTLAASTQSVIHGAGVMVLLACMSTVPNLLMVLLPRALGGIRTPLWGRLGAGMPLVSALWMVLMSAGAFGWIPHAHASFTVKGSAFMVMFW
jgi:sulfite exporter TauE/SafE